MDVSVIVPVYNDAARLRHCLSALEAQTYAGSYEVVVVDNGSSDDPDAVVAEHPRARLVREERPGSYAARNRGLREASGALVAFTDADCIPESTWLERAAEAAHRHGAGFVVGRVQLFARNPGRPNAVELWELSHGFQQELRVRRMNYGATANLVVPRTVLDAVGHFDPALRSSGDKEWGIRATAKGFPPVYADDVVVRHPARGSWRELRGKYLRISAGKNDLRQLDHTVPDGTEERRGLLPAGQRFVRHRWAEARQLAPRDRLRYVLVMLLVVGLRKYDTLRLAVRPRVVR